MPPTPEDPFAFKFQFLGENGQPAGFFRKKGRFDGTTLTLDDLQLPAPLLLDVVVREDRVLMAVPQPPDPGEDSAGPSVGHLAVAAGSKNAARTLKNHLDVARSGTWAENHRDELAKKGRGAAFRSDRCPHCGATVVLSDMPETPQLFCPFCEALSNTATAGDPPGWEKLHRLCDECGYFSAPKKFTVFYFYFLLVVYGWSRRTTFRCPACMRPDAWKMLLGNAPFVLGLPVALTQLVRTYGSDLAGGPYQGLDAGNKAARKGDFATAVAKYRAILERVGAGAGVKYNLGLALLGQGDEARAADTFRLSLQDCANYGPAATRLRPLLESLGRHDELAELKRQWDDADDDPADDGAEPVAAGGNFLEEAD